MEAVTIRAASFPELNLLFHIPNGGFRTGFEGKMFKAMGVKAGVLDYCLPVKRNGYTSLWLEMKADKGRLTQEQQWWREQLTEQGARVVVCYGWEEAMRELIRYLRGDV